MYINNSFDIIGIERIIILNVSQIIVGNVCLYVFAFVPG